MGSALIASLGVRILQVWGTEEPLLSGGVGNWVRLVVALSGLAGIVVIAAQGSGAQSISAGVVLIVASLSWILALTWQARALDDFSGTGSSGE